MSVFLIAIPKGTRNTPSFEKETKELKGLLDKIGKTYTINFLGKHYNPFKVVEPVSDKTVIVLNWERKGSIGQFLTKGDHWAVSAGHNVTAQILENMVRRGGRLQYNNPVWGHYCTVYGDRYMDQLVAWNTTPALEAIHYSENENAVFISNKPLLVALALVDGDKDVILSEDFIVEYLLFGYSVTGNSAFKGVKTLNVNESLRVQKGKIFIDEIPFGLQVKLQDDHTLQEASDCLVQALKNSMQRSLSQLNGLPLELRMSGGKDSRLLLGLIKDQNYPVRGVTFGVEGESETIVAQTLCSMANVPLEIKSPKLTKGESYIEQLSNTIKSSDGIPPSEAHTGIYVGAEPFEGEDQGIMLGQWPLMKGGMARKMRYTIEEVEGVIFRQASHMVNTKKREKYEKYLRNWLDDTAFTSLLDILYLFARNFRSGRWLHGHAHLYSKESFLVYPLADMEVCAISDAINNAFRVSEKAYFMSLKEIWPEALQFPLSGNSKWRFEQFKKDPLISGDSYELRNRDLIENALPRKGSSRSSIIIELSKQIMLHPCKEKIWESLTDNMQNFIEQSSMGIIKVPQGYTLRELLKNLWRILSAEVWYSKAWLN